MSTIALPDFALVLLFGGPAAEFAQRAFGAITKPDDVAARLLARQLTAVDVTKATRLELTALARAAVNACARVYAIAVESDAAGMSLRLGTLSIEAQFAATQTDCVRFEPVSTDRRGERGPFDIIGDVHGCADELIALLEKLGYRAALTGTSGARCAVVEAPPGRRAFFVGDLVDRGPNSPDVLRVVMDMVAAGSALCVAGNHDIGCLRWLEGRHTSLKHGLELTVAQFAPQSPAFRERVRVFIASLKGHLWVDGGRLAVAHAGVQEGMIGRASGRVRAFSLYGDTESKTAADGLPVRYHWALDYHGATAVVYGHTPVAEAGWVNKTLCIDTGCCFGGHLTALRWPEREIVSVPSRAAYAVKGRAFGHPPARPKRD